MRRIYRHLTILASSFWTVPVLCVIAAVILAESVVSFDRSLPPGTKLALLNSVLDLGIDGSRALLGGIGAATFGAAATAFLHARHFSRLSTN